MKLNELESAQSYYREPKAKKLFCLSCRKPLIGFGFEDGDECEACIEIEAQVIRRQKELEQ